MDLRTFSENISDIQDISDDEQTTKTTDMILNEKFLQIINSCQNNTILYSTYAFQYLIWCSVTIIALSILAIKCGVEYLYVNALKICAWTLEWSDNTLPESPMKRIILDRQGQDPYLLRHYLLFKNRKSFPFNIFIHKIMKSDDDKDLHDHPWGFFHLILSGGYWEELHVNGDMNAGIEKVWRGPGYWNIVSTDHKHKIELGEEQPWTIFIPFKTKQNWGFWVKQTSQECPTGHSWVKIENKKYLDERNRRSSVINRSMKSD